MSSWNNVDYCCCFLDHSEACWSLFVVSPVRKLFFRNHRQKSESAASWNPLSRRKRFSLLCTSEWNKFRGLELKAEWSDFRFEAVAVITPLIRLFSKNPQVFTPDLSWPWPAALSALLRGSLSALFLPSSHSRSCFLPLMEGSRWAVNGGLHQSLSPLMAMSPSLLWVAGSLRCSASLTSTNSFNRSGSEHSACKRLLDWHQGFALFRAHKSVICSN